MIQKRKDLEEEIYNKLLLSYYSAPPQRSPSEEEFISTLNELQAIQYCNLSLSHQVEINLREKRAISFVLDYFAKIFVDDSKK